MFCGAVEIVRFMQLPNHVPPMIVVSGSDTEWERSKSVELRARDLTPPRDPVVSKICPEMASTHEANFAHFGF
jgi:hypothetical protein